MKLFTIAILFLLVPITYSAASEKKLKALISQCQSIKDNVDRLECYDTINGENAVQNQTDSNYSNKQGIKKEDGNQFPVLIADLNEPNLSLSIGNLDFLGNKNRAVLLGIGNRIPLKDFKLVNGSTIAFNAFGQIRSQFDVDELDTRNNRGGALINTDFSVGGEIVKSLDDWNWRFSYTHRSTHLGDEFLIDNPEFIEKRLNLSYELIKWDASKAIKNWDLYAGLGFITRSEPGNLDKYLWQAGWQYHGNQKHFFKPFWGVDLSSWGAYDWNINFNMRAGFEIIGLTNTPFQIHFEYFDGHSPYGQFFTEDLTFSGITLLKNWR